jgi:hypothetical protein
MAKHSRPRRAHGPGPAGNTRGSPSTLMQHDIAGRVRSGELDDELPSLVEAITWRMRLIEERRAAEVLATLVVGEHVRISGQVKPRYLEGATGEVHIIEADHVVVCLNTPIGRFKNGHINCPPGILKRIEAAEA